jgi:hypothetical protein
VCEGGLGVFGGREAGAEGGGVLSEVGELAGLRRVEGREVVVPGLDVPREGLEGTDEVLERPGERRRYLAEGERGGGGQR